LTAALQAAVPAQAHHNGRGNGNGGGRTTNPSDNDGNSFVNNNRPPKHGSRGCAPLC